VVLYDAVLAVQAIAWLSVGVTALNNNLARDHVAVSMFRLTNRNAYAALVLYALLALAALWFPLAAAIVTTLSWLFWLVLSIRLKHT
jgi:hypothetical protein